MSFEPYEEGLKILMSTSMEGPGGQALNKVLQKKDVILSQEDRKNLDIRALDKEEAQLNQPLEKQLMQTEEIEQQISDLLFMDDKRLDMKEELTTIELHEIYYLRLQSKIQEIESKIQELYVQQAGVQDERLRNIHKKLSRLSEMNEEYKNELEYAQEILDSYPETILNLTQELTEHKEFLDTYKDQTDNFYDN